MAMGSVPAIGLTGIEHLAQVPTNRPGETTAERLCHVSRFLLQICSNTSMTAKCFSDGLASQIVASTARCQDRRKTPLDALFGHRSLPDAR